MAELAPPGGRGAWSQWTMTHFQRKWPGIRVHRVRKLSSIRGDGRYQHRALYVNLPSFGRLTVTSRLPGTYPPEHGRSFPDRLFRGTTLIADRIWTSGCP